MNANTSQIYSNKERKAFYQVEDGVEAFQLAVDDDLEVLLVVQVSQQLDEGRLRQSVQVDGGDLPAALRRRVQDPLQHRQTWRPQRRDPRQLLDDVTSFSCRGDLVLLSLVLIWDGFNKI